MGYSGSPIGNGKNKSIIDASVGALVWVRRRNGSWWPGQIMGLDEFSDHALVSPAAGTPVKLLGRQDPTIDWYNLEKSKRVKAFRCGEYDECIEKAKASTSNSHRRTVRYARREDAILDALEIEKARLGHNYRISSSSNGFCAENVVFAKEKHRMTISCGQGFSSDDEEEESDCCRNGLVFVSGLGSGADLHSYVLDNGPQLSESGVSFEEPTIIGNSKVLSSDVKSRGTLNDSEDDGAEGVMRIKGLEDLGVGVQYPKTGSFASNSTLVYQSKTCTSSLRRKRTQMGDAHELLKRKHRRRQLTKVLESTVMLPVHVQSDSYKPSPHEVISECKPSGVESNDSKKDSSLLLSNNSDSTGISYENGSTSNGFEIVHYPSHVIDEETKGNDDFGWSETKEKIFEALCETAEKGAADKSLVALSTCKMRYDEEVLEREFFQICHTEATTSKSVVFKDSATIDEEKAYNSQPCHKMDKGTSKWQSKGKRNLRRKGRSKRRDRRKYADLNSKACSIPEKGNSDWNASGAIRKSTLEYDKFNGSYCCNIKAKSKLRACGSTDFNKVCKQLCSNEELHIGNSASGIALAPLTANARPYRQSRYMINSKYQSSYFLGKSYQCQKKLYNVKQEVRFTNPLSHVPLQSLRSQLSNKVITGYPLTVVVLPDGYCDKLMYGVPFDDSANGNPHAAVSVRVGRRQRTPKMKIVNSHSLGSKSSKHSRSGLSYKKIRKLSSLSGSRSFLRKAAAEKVRDSTCGCIPVKLVFSRIHEAVNRPVKQPQPSFCD